VTLLEFMRMGSVYLQSSDDIENLADAPQFSPLCVISGLLGLLSLLVLANLGFLVVGIVAVVLGLWGTVANRGVRLGDFSRWAGHFGVAAALFGICFALVARQVEQNRLVKQATVYAERYLQLLSAGDYAQTQGLDLPPMVPPMMDETGNSLITATNSPPYFDDPLRQKIMTAAPRGQWTFVRSLDTTQRGNVSRYVLIFEPPPASIAGPISIEMHRKPADLQTTQLFEWQVGALTQL
jgi:hypothetical protein